MIMCVLLCYPVSIHMSQLLSTRRPISSYVHPLGGGHIIFAFSAVRRPTWFPDILGNSSYPIFCQIWHAGLLG